MLNVHDLWHISTLRIDCTSIAVLMLATLPLLVQAADELLLLEVQINGASTGKIGEFMLQDGILRAQGKELLELGFRLPSALVMEPDDLITLLDLPGLAWRLEQASQTLFITASNDNLQPQLLQVGKQAAIRGAVESGTGVTLNYDINSMFAGGRNITGGLLDARLFSSRGVLSSTLLSYAGGPSGVTADPLIRLDSTYTFSDPEHLRRYRLGDFITNSLSWTRPVRFGGVQINSDFSLRPNLITFPLPSVSGSVAIPSTVDVLVNGTRLFSQQVEAGPFEIPQLPVIGGGGTISMSLTNALGQQVTTTLPFYASSALLAPGLQAYSMQLGAVRRHWGLLSNDYGELAALATYRRGLSSTVTAEISAEGTAGTTMAGAGVVMNLGNIAILNTAVATSTGSGRNGSQFSIGIQRVNTVFSFGASATLAEPDFRDVATANGDATPRRQVNASIGMAFGSFGSMGIAYAGIERDTKPPIPSYQGPQPPQASGNINYLQPAQRADILSVSYSIQARNLAFFATGFRDFAAGGGNGLMIGLTLPLGSRSSLNLGIGKGSSGSYGQVQAAKAPVTVGDWGYQVYGSAADGSDHAFTQLQYKAPQALFSAGISQIDQETLLRLQAQGALSFVDGSLFASNLIQDSFAVVNTDGLANVGVLLENRVMGRTGADGRLLLPDLRAFDVNRIAIEATDIPPDARIAVVERQVRPQDRSGVVVKFSITISRGALLLLVDADGVPLPVGSTATLLATGVMVPVGYDGNAYIEGLDLHNVLNIEKPDGRRCSLAFDYQPVPGDIPTIGPLHCLEQKP